MNVILIAALAWTSPNVHAVVGCGPERPLDRSFGEINAQVLKAMQVDDADRRTAAAYAAEHQTTEAAIKARYAATGDLICKGVPVGQANVTLVGNVITAAAHTLYDTKKGCTKVGAKVPKCKLVLEVEGQKQDYELDEVINSGWICGSYDANNSPTDWVVIRLKKSVDPRVKPYRLGRDRRKEGFTGIDVMAVAKSQDWPSDSKAAYVDKPRHYGDCKIEGMSNFDLSIAVSTNCDISPGSSGGALLSRGPDPEFIGVHQGGSAKSKPSPTCPKIDPRKTQGKFDLCWSTSSVLVTNDLRTTLLEIEEKEVPKSAPAPAPTRGSGGGTDL